MRHTALLVCIVVFFLHAPVLTLGWCSCTHTHTPRCLRHCCACPATHRRWSLLRASRCGGVNADALLTEPACLTFTRKHHGAPTARSPPCPPSVPPRPLQASHPPHHNQGSWPGWVGGCGVWELERNSRRAPPAPLANVKCLQTEKNRPERLFRLEINVTEKCGSRAINAAFFATHYVSALKREGAHFWHVFNLLGSE